MPGASGFGPVSDIVSDGEQVLRSALRGDPAARAEVARLRAALTELAEEGNAKARSLLGGIALEHDREPAAAFHHFSLAADQEDPAGRRGLGHLYAKGVGVEQDLEAAERLFRLAAEGGDAYAKHNLAVIHLDGDSTKERMSPQEVMSLLKEAAGQGIHQASAALGDWYAGLDRESDAFSWYMKAAIAGHGPAMFAVAVRFRDGLGAARNEVQAVRWFLKMLTVGNGDGIHEAIRTARSMSDADIRRAGRMAGDQSAAETLIRTVRPNSAD
ncbi:tetratricopeptide repeat protein [Kitasatospora sp. NPDC057015]|uniref:tetratricopeptide repeat protein n=1 Tax=Kitasatospora sp. NPDC057015 TaxID=3346001 RepID=UPI0036434713